MPSLHLTGHDHKRRRDNTMPRRKDHNCWSAIEDDEESQTVELGIGRPHRVVSWEISNIDENTCTRYRDRETWHLELRR